MSRTYKAIGINLKSMPLGSQIGCDFDTRVWFDSGGWHQGHVNKLKLGGRSGLFVVNELLIAKGRSSTKLLKPKLLNLIPV